MNKKDIPSNSCKIQRIIQGEGTVSQVPAGGTIPSNTNVTFTCTPRGGYTFQKAVVWDDDGSITYTSNVFSFNTLTYTYKNVYVYFTPLSYTLSLPVSGGVEGGGYTTGAGTYQYGTVVHITAEPFNHNRFSHWGDGSEDRYRDVTITGNWTLYAYFVEAPKYTITGAIGGDGGGYIEGVGTYYEGSNVYLHAHAGYGSRFDHWDGGSTNPERLITNLKSDITVTAYFSRIYNDLYVSSNIASYGHKVVSYLPNPFVTSEVYEHIIFEKPIILVAIKYPNGTVWKFDRWELLNNDTGDVTTFHNLDITFNLTYNCKATAYYIVKQEQYIKINYPEGGGGRDTIEPSVGMHTNPPLVPFKIKAINELTSNFSYWKIKDGIYSSSTSENPYYIISAENYIEVTPVYELRKIVIEMEIQGDGTVEPPLGLNYFDPRDTGYILFNATPAYGWEFDHWYSNAEGWDGDLANQQTFRLPVKIIHEGRYRAIFKRSGCTPYKLYTAITPEGAGKVMIRDRVQGWIEAPSEMSLCENDMVRLRADSANGYKFGFWTSQMEPPYAYYNEQNPVDRVMYDLYQPYVTMIAHFYDLTTFDLILRALPEEGGTVIPAGHTRQQEGSTVNIHAIPNEGYRFVQWSNGDSYANTRVTMNNNITLIAYFETTTPIKKKTVLYGIMLGRKKKNEEIKIR